jgi:hypothetical protein
LTTSTGSWASWWRGAWRRRLAGAFKDFHRFLVARKAAEIEATAVTLTPQPGFTGTTLTVTEQRRLFRRWSFCQQRLHNRPSRFGPNVPHAAHWRRGTVWALARPPT